MKPKKDKNLPKKDPPRINFYSLSSSKKDFDFFPNLIERGNEIERKTIRSLKDGTYQPFMQTVEYNANFDKKTSQIISASPLNDHYAVTPHDIFDYSAMYQKKRDKTYSQIETITKQFEKSNIPIMPRYYHNPLQYFDHILLADAYVNSYAGTVLDAYIDFIMPKELHPVLVLRNPEKFTEDEQKKLIDENQYVIDALNQIDNFYSDDGPEKIMPYLGASIQQKFKAAITSCLVYGRNMIAFENWEHLPQFEYNGREITDIPNVLKTMQSIDMGMVQIDPFTGKLGGIYVYNSVPFISSDNMIYLLNKFASPMIGSLYYGFSLMQRTIDAVRLYRRIMAVNFAQFIRTSYAGMGYFIFDSTGYPETVRSSIRSMILNNYQAGETGIIDIANINDFKYIEAKINPEINALIELQNAVVKIQIGVMGMPQSLIFDESAATRSTMVGRVMSFIDNQISQLRESFGQQLASQWYLRNLRILFKDKKDLLDTFTISVKFDEMNLETKNEKIERLLLETQLNPLTDKYIGEQLNDKQYQNHIDPKKRETENNSPVKFPFPRGQTFSVKDADTGKTSRISTAAR